MSNILTMQAVARKLVSARPDLKAAVIDLLELALSEIADGASEENECELAIRDFDELQKGTS